MNQKTYIVYKHQNKINNKIYIGITKNGDNPNERWRNGFGYKNNDKFFKDIIKYGWDNFDHFILKKELSEEEAILFEKKYILLYNSVEKGYNNNYGCGQTIGEASRHKISEALKGVPKKQESIEKQLKTKQQRCGSQRGVSAYVTNGRKVKCKETGDIFANISEANRWSHTSKVGECCNGNRKHAGHHPDTNQLLSWEFVDDNQLVTIQCEDDYETKKVKKILCIETNTIYLNATEASKETGVACCNILRVCNGQRKTAGKLHWSFIYE